jgi:predicted transcriptional regulator
MSRPSIISIHPDREAIEHALVSGQIPITQIASQFGISRDAIYRYKQGSLAPALRDALKASNSSSVPSLLERVLNLADDALQARLQLQASGHHVASIRAGEHELKTLAVLLDRLGVTDTETVEALRQALGLMEALRQLAHTHPDAVEHLGHILVSAGDDDLGPAFLAITQSRKALS